MVALMLFSSNSTAICRSHVSTMADWFGVRSGEVLLEGSPDLFLSGCDDSVYHQTSFRKLARRRRPYLRESERDSRLAVLYIVSTF